MTSPQENETKIQEGFIGEHVETDLNQKRKRKKSNYKKINNQTRQKLIEMVYLNDYLLKDAAKMLGINYSTAKTILRIFRIEKRIEKKNAEEEKELKTIIHKFQNDKIQKNQILAEHVKSKLNGNEERNNPITAEGQINNKLNINLPEIKQLYTNNLDTLNSSNTPPCQDSNNNEINYLLKKVQDFQLSLNSCFDQIKNNQMYMSQIIQYLSKFNHNTNSTNYQNNNYMRAANPPYSACNNNMTSEFMKMMWNSKKGDSSFSSHSSDNFNMMNDPTSAKEDYRL